ncbi:NusG domain II-containing protein [Desulfosporosinus lacus]|uniref:NusG domain II n=1 Tax=Desulfosporosinus lacus DSM 15449 TaxID=1121420 RepID=A0A1M6DMS3_9FIRM|nr:NusG domain II-containing protein [Desulfosporosinus lacus]SHI74461.1 NusG domain II [Desulfosporosinus lacus DSM 15449]
MAEIDLNSVQEPQTFEFKDGIRVLIVAEKGSIKFVEADCPDKICIKTGTLTKPGDRAICLPSKTIVKVEDD